MSDLKDLVQTTNELSSMLDTVLELENSKLEAVAHNNIPRLDIIMNEEQALMLQFRGLDSKREKIQSDLGFADQTFIQIAENLEPEMKESFKSLHSDIASKILKIQEIVDCNKKYIDLHLYGIDKLISTLEQGRKDMGYNDRGSKLKSTDGKFNPTKV